MRFNLFSKRQKELRGEVPDIYVYDIVPNALRVQIIHIWQDTLGTYSHYVRYSKVQEAYQFIVDVLCREYGLFHLPSHDKYSDRMYLEELANFFLKEKDLEKVIDIIELSFKAINIFTKDYQYLHRHNNAELIEKAIDELNYRFKEHGVGFQFVENEIIKIDSELLHSEAVKPALKLLNQKNYKGAQEEFLSAYEHYRHGKNKESLNDCLKAFESTMKAICDKHKWQYKSGDTAKTLIQICFDKGLIPAFWQAQFTSLRSMLESSIPTGRNKLSGHGQGTEPISIPNYLVAYMLHMTASTLVFLTTAEKDIK
ncbi:STM4504/CBY_0614 family protein [Aliarcobacter butzleri]